MSDAKVKADSFWGDLVNALLMSPPHREQPASDAKGDDVKKGRR